jgi:hypothetical protein
VRFLAKASVATLEAPDTLQEAEDRQYVDEQPDLLKIDSILVSTGMNANDDVFLASELLPARNTAKHKPLNVEHSDARIIGHMTNSYISTKEGNRIPEAEILEDPLVVPKSFDVASESVMYAAVFPDEARKIRELAQTGELFVSVEAWFSDYDYIVGNRIVERNSVTAAYLEQILRINGGDGLVDNQKVGRVLRDLIIAGIGLVKTPANKDSVIKSVSVDRSGLNLDTDVDLMKLIKEFTKALLEDDCPSLEVAMAGEKKKTQAGASKDDDLEQRAKEHKTDAEAETAGEAQQVADESKNDVDATKDDGKAVEAKTCKKTKKSSEAETQDAESAEVKAEAADQEEQQQKVDERFAELEDMILQLKEQIVERDQKISAFDTTVAELTHALQEARGNAAEEDEASSKDSTQEKPAEEAAEEEQEAEEAEESEEETQDAEQNSDEPEAEEAEESEEAEEEEAAEEEEETEDSEEEAEETEDSEEAETEEAETEEAEEAKEEEEPKEETPKEKPKKNLKKKEEKKAPKKKSKPKKEKKEAPKNDSTDDVADDAATEETEPEEKSKDEDGGDLINIDLDDEAIEEILQDALDNAEQKDEETVKFQSDDDGEDNLQNQFDEVFRDMDMGLILDKEE